MCVLHVCTALPTELQSLEYSAGKVGVCRTNANHLLAVLPILLPFSAER